MTDATQERIATGVLDQLYAKFLEYGGTPNPKESAAEDLAIVALLQLKDWVIETLPRRINKRWGEDGSPEDMILEGLGSSIYAAMGFGWCLRNLRTYPDDYGERGRLVFLQRLVELTEHIEQYAESEGSVKKSASIMSLQSPKEGIA